MSETRDQQGGTVRGAVAQRQQEPRPITLAKSYKSDLAQVLPQHIESKAFIGAAIGALRKNPDLMTAAENAPGAFMDALMECASLGHVPGGKEFYLTARRSKHHNNQPIIHGMEGYRGVIERMYRSGAVASVIVREVCQGDDFRFVEGVDEVPQHNADWFGGDRNDPNKIIGGYAYARLTTGATSRVVVLSRADFEKAKKDSDAGRNDVGPWKDHYRAMCWKTLAHRLEPWVPTSAEYRREALRATAEADRVRGSRVDTSTGELLDDVIDADIVEEPGDAQ
jgi:recombination protein RecT